MLPIITDGRQKVGVETVKGGKIDTGGGGGGGARQMNSQQELYKRCYFLFLDNSLLVK